jgi:hypothetical protein
MSGCFIGPALRLFPTSSGTYGLRVRSRYFDSRRKSILNMFGVFLNLQAEVGRFSAAASLGESCSDRSICPTETAFSLQVGVGRDRCWLGPNPAAAPASALCARLRGPLRASRGTL